MLGVPCFGPEHKKRLMAIVDRLTPEVWWLLTEAWGIAGKLVHLQGPENSSSELAFMDRVLAAQGRTRLPGEDGEIENVWFDMKYNDKDTKQAKE